MAFVSGEPSRPLRLARLRTAERRSFSEHDGDVRIAVDTIRADRPLCGLHLECDVPPAALFVATRGWEAHVAVLGGELLASEIDLDVPPLSQYAALDDAPPELRAKHDALCSPTALTMLLRYYGIAADILSTAAAVYDRAYNGTGNWAFNVAYASRLGLVGCVAYLRDLNHARALLDAGIPLALSIAWEPGELPGAASSRSDGHLVVLRGFSAEGDPLVNDPARPDLRARYPRAAFAAAWLGHGGAAYVLTPPPFPAALFA